MLSYFLAVLAAAANGTSSVLQRRANRRIPRKQNMSWRLIWSLLHQPVWFGGVLAITVGFLLQASALSFGGLAVVEPVLVLELPFTLILASRVFRQQMGWREWASAAAMTAGLAGLLAALAPSAGRPSGIRWYVWLAGIGVNLAVVGGLAAWGRRGPAGDSPKRRGSRPAAGAVQAAVLATAAGAAFGLCAALMKGMTQTLRAGIGAALGGWQLYAMIAVGVLGMFLTQSAMNAGQLIAAQPGLTLSDPITSVLWGVLIFHERVREGWFIIAEVAAMAVIAAAVVALARSPLLSADQVSQRSRG